MTSYPQIHVVTKYQEFIRSLAGVGVPSSVDKNYLKQLGYKSSYDEKFLVAIKFIGLVEDKRGGAPTDRWSELRLNLGKALAAGLRQGYAELFDFYPDAHVRDEEALANFFRAKTSGDSDAVSRMVNAFVAIRDLADFDDLSISDEELNEGVDSGGGERNQSGRPFPDEKQPKHGVVNVNIQLQLPSDATGEVYEKFFEAMKKHGIV